MSDNLTGPGPKLPPEFLATLGGLDWTKLPAQRRLALWQSWNAGKGERPALADELGVRDGTLSPLDRLRLAHATDNTMKATRPDPIATTPALAKLTGPARLAALDAMREATRLQREIAGLSNSKGGGMRVEAARADAIANAQGRLAAINERYPGLIPE